MGGETSAGAAASGFFLTLLCLLAQALTAFVPPILECFLAMSMACCITEQSCLGNLCKAAGILLQKGLSLTGKLLAALPLYLGMLAHLGCIVLCGTLCSLTGNSRGQALLTCFASAVRCMMACIALFFGLAVTGTALLFMLGGV